MIEFLLFLLFLLFSVAALLSLHHFAVVVLLVQPVRGLVPLHLVRFLCRFDGGQLILLVLLFCVNVGKVVLVRPRVFRLVGLAS